MKSLLPITLWVASNLIPFGIMADYNQQTPKDLKLKHCDSRKSTYFSNYILILLNYLC